MDDNSDNPARYKDQQQVSVVNLPTTVFSTVVTSNVIVAMDKLKTIAKPVLE